MSTRFINDYDAVNPRLLAQEKLVIEIGEMLASIIDGLPDSKKATLEQTSVLADDTDSLRVIAGAFFDAGYTLTVQAKRRE